MNRTLVKENFIVKASISAVKLLTVLNNLEYVLAVELLTASQALDFRHPLKPGAGVLAAHHFLRQRIPHANQDYEVGNDMEICVDMLRHGELATQVEDVTGPLS